MFIMIALILQNLQRLFNAYLLPTHPVLDTGEACLTKYNKTISYSTYCDIHSAINTKATDLYLRGKTRQTRYVQT